MLLPTPADLRAALSRYADAVIEDERRSTPETIRQREDTAYTLCVMTGVSDVRDALSTADALLSRRAPESEAGRRDHSGAVPV
ncbi:DUF5133 domain-containing protein [Streptomyces sp. SID9727]|uniref:DUF5133 domain-containing protein n=1 Tax=Streptomyces sp. SID9727 TaxID=2706114 RepID=UPI0013CA1852|nr:DUF5133 domain-containing protein [Streptomyces sp. SID9727]